MINQENVVNKWISSDEVCHLLMISKRTLQTYRDRGILSFAQVGRKIYYKASDIDAYLEAHYIKSRSQGREVYYDCL
jgi:excisionase family DNA binding protein